MKKTLPVAVILAIVCAVAGLIVIQHQAAKKPASPSAEAARQLESVPTMDEVLPPLPPEEAPPAVTEVPPPAPADSATQSTPPSAEPATAAPRAQRTAPQGAQGGRPAKEPLQDPLARDALALVGVDPGAEEYWFAAINDPSLSAHERQDLIEDLNEEGLSDPRHPDPEDLPLILSRIQVIEAAGPYAMDQVNADAFQEAYKDLVNLANVALGGGEPVR